MSFPFGQLSDFFRTERAWSTKSGIRVEVESESIEVGSEEELKGSTESLNGMLDLMLMLMGMESR